MIARTLMTGTPFTVRETDPVRRAASLMREHDVGFIPVVDDTTTPRLTGVITDRDIAVRCVATGKHLDDPVSAFMTRPPFATVPPESPVEEVVEMMERARVRRLPVVSGDGRVLGVIALADVVREVGRRDAAKVEELLERVSAAAHALV